METFWFFRLRFRWSYDSISIFTRSLISSLMTPTTTPTPSLVKTRLKVAENSFQYVARLRVWWVIIASLYHLVSAGCSNRKSVIWPKQIRKFKPAKKTIPATTQTWKSVLVQWLLILESGRGKDVYLLWKNRDLIFIKINLFGTAKGLKIIATSGLHYYRSSFADRVSWARRTCLCAYCETRLLDENIYCNVFYTSYLALDVNVNVNI